MTTAASALPLDTGATTFGHPRGLTVLFSTEMWERFSYYGMRSLLVLYMMKHLLVPEQAAQVWGLDALHRGLEGVFGPLPRQPFASQIFGFYGGLVYLTPILGGIVADRVLGRRTTVVIGAALMAAGHFLMAFEEVFLFALLLLILGNGAFKPNISSQVGQLYAAADPRRDRAYSIFYLGINIGAFLAPLVCGSLGEGVGWHYGFGAAGVGMTLALIIYISGLRWLPADRRAIAPAPAVAAPARRSHDHAALIAILVLFLPTTLFWAIYYQGGNTMVLWIDATVDRQIGAFGWQTQIPTTWFQAINPLMIFSFTPLVVGLWARQAARGREPKTIVKMALGCVLTALSFGLLALLAGLGGGAKVSWLWLIATNALSTVGELYLSPIGLSLVSKIAPLRMLSALMGLWLATNFTGNIVAGWFGTLWELMAKPTFFLVCAAAGLVAAAAFYAMKRFVEPLIGE